MTKSEVLGRLVSCGFKIRDYKEAMNITYFYVEKVRPPEFDENPTYGPFISLNRVGLGGEIIKVYKFRTMHPYAEYLQEYIYRKFGSKNGDKFEKDFRVTKWGLFFRRFWIDELPMF